MTLKRVLWEKRIYILGLVGMLITTLPMILWKDFYLDWFRNTWLIERNKRRKSGKREKKFRFR